VVNTLTPPSVLDADARVARAWSAVSTVPDPEVPALTVCDLGLVREITAQPDGGIEIVLTPTYSGCPATDVIEQSVREAVQAAGLGPVTMTLRRAPAWTSDWMSEEGRRKLKAYGIAPPGPVDAAAGVPVRFLGRRQLAPVACPRCDSHRTERLSAFGSTACKALYRCLDCLEPFEHFKPI